MASPTRYSRSKDFTEETGATTDNADINTELDAVQQTLDDIIDNMALIQRDDGELLNRKVGWDQLAEAVVLSLGKAETWAADTAYTANKTVIYGDAWYRAIDTHTSGATFAGDAAHWDQLIDFAAWATAAAASAAAASASEGNAASSETTASAAAAAAAADAATANLAVGVAVRSETASAGQTAFTAPTYTVGTEMLLVFVNGALSRAYTESSTTAITFTSAMAGGEKVVILRSKRLTTAAAESTNVVNSSGGAANTVSGRFDERPSLLDAMTDAEKAAVLLRTNSIDVTSAVQTAINDAAAAGKSPFVPDGLYRCDDDVYFHYDVTNNPGYPSGSFEGGKLKLYGHLPMEYQDWLSGGFGRGAVFSFAADKGMKIGNGAIGATGVRGIRLEGFSVVGNTTGKLIDVNAAPHFSQFKRLSVGNANTTTGGIAFYNTDIWNNGYEDIVCWGRKDGGTAIGEGFVHESGAYGGGNNRFINITASRFETNIRSGKEYNAGNAICRNDYWLHPQGSHGKYGFRVMHGTDCSKIEQIWSEFNAHSGLWFSDSCREWVVEQGQFVDNDAGLTGQIVIGAESAYGTDDERGAIAVELRKVRHQNYVNAGIRRYSCPTIRDTHLQRPSFHHSGVRAIVIDDDDPHGLFIHNPDWGKDTTNGEVPAGYRVVENTTFADRRHFCELLTDGPDSVASDFDMSGWDRCVGLYLPDTLLASRTVKLPTAGVYRGEITVVKRYAAGTVTIDAGTGNSITTPGASGQTVVLGSGKYGVSIRLKHLPGSNAWMCVGISDEHKVAAVADLSQTISATPTQVEVQAISDKVDELLAALRTANRLKT